MLRGRVTGNIVSTKKNENLVGSKFMKVEIQAETKYEIVVIDTVGAGVGEDVLVVTGHNAIYAFSAGKNIPVDAVIVGIID
jgi:ethanolamine utilization protein EutN